MYYPKSQVKTALYTNGGEYFRLDTDSEYKGYYWVNSKGQYFSGKTPNQTPSIELIKRETEDSEEASLPKNYSSWVRGYNNDIFDNNPGVSPQKDQPKPTDDNYSVGVFTRYFTKKSNQNIYYEISKKDYEKLVNQDSSIKWQLYQPITLTWVLTGDKSEVYKANRNTVLIAEQRQRLPGFRKIFRDDYLQYYKE